MDDSAHIRLDNPMLFAKELTWCGAWSDDVNAALSADFQRTPMIGIGRVARVQRATVVVLLAENAAHVAAAAAVDVRLAKGVVGFLVAPSGIGQCQFLILSLAAAFVAHGLSKCLLALTLDLELFVAVFRINVRLLLSIYICVYIYVPKFCSALDHQATHIWQLTRCS